MDLFGENQEDDSFVDLTSPPMNPASRASFSEPANSLGGRGVPRRSSSGGVEVLDLNSQAADLPNFMSYQELLQSPWVGNNVEPDVAGGRGAAARHTGPDGDPAGTAARPFRAPRPAGSATRGARGALRVAAAPAGSGGTRRVAAAAGGSGATPRASGSAATAGGSGGNPWPDYAAAGLEEEYEGFGVGASDWTSDSDDGDKFEWDSDGEAEASSAQVSRNLDAPGPSTLVRQDTNVKANGAAPSDSLVRDFVGMGFTEEMVLKAIKETGESDTEALLNLLLTYKLIGGDPSVDGCSASGHIPPSVEDDDADDVDLENWDDDDAGGNSNRDPNSDGSGDEDFLQEMSQKDEKIVSLMSMGFPEDEAKMAITRCGLDASVAVLVDSIYASQTAGGGYSGNLSDNEDMERYCFNSFGGRKKTKFMEDGKKKRKRYGGGAQGNQGPLDGSHDEPMPLPNPMVGFNLPSDRLRSVNRRLPEQAIGPPFFYYENVALAPKGVWTTISRFLYDIEPEFVDSKFFCAAARKRGYIHNLPIENRSPLLPLPPKTIYEAFPSTKKWWPLWDPRRQFNCLQTCVASAKLTERIRCALSSCENPPSPRVQKYVLDECRKWNLVWVGKNKVAPLEPDEMEFLLGFPRNHTRGVSRTERYKSLGNSFHVDTVAYHLSVLRDMFPNGMNVLSLFTGIGGAEVALHRLGIRMKTVVSVEISEVNRTVLKSWWEQTQTGTLIEIADVQSLTNDRIESFIRRFGSFDLVIGGSPCNNLAGSNRHHRDGLEGEQSALFYHYFRILDAVKTTMARM